MLGQEIKAKRQEKGLTQTALAELINTRQSTIAMYESNRLTPGKKRLILLRDILNISLDKYLS